MKYILEILFVLNVEKVIFQILKNGKMKEINGYCIMKMDGFRLKLFRLRKVMNGLDIWMKAMNIPKKLKLLLKKILIVGRILKVLL